MEEVFLILIALFSAYYFYKKTFKNNGCNCGSKDCPSEKK
ncbi:FeoB-associated Cys-rich membrane protein [Campylobacterota bacterium DY0563]|nr:FeoB-associated Cys-rich membrane protein [Halarcobacter sp.]